MGANERPWTLALATDAPPGSTLPEIATYADEPPQMASGTVGKSGFLRLGFERRGERTILADLGKCPFQ